MSREWTEPLQAVIPRQLTGRSRKHELPARSYQRALYGRNIANKIPETLITDGLPSYRYAWRTTPDKKPVHIREISLEGAVHNHKMERMNGEVRDREPVMRGLKNTDTAIIKGMQIYHNYFRPHMGLKRKTPAEAAGIKIERENPWVTVIQNAAKSEGVKDRTDSSQSLQ